MKSVKVGIIVASLGAAAAIFFFFGGEDKLPDDDSSKTTWRCQACGHSFELSAYQLDLEQKKANQGSPLNCPKCGKLKAYQLMACLTCGTLFFPPEVPGEPGVCPKCPQDGPPPPDRIEERPVEEAAPVEGEPEKPRVAPKSV